MNSTIQEKGGNQRVKAWDRTTRLFHWINLACVLALTAIGLGILNHDAFGITREGERVLKIWHVYVGYVFAINLGWRFVWAFIGSRSARWGSFLPFRKGFGAQLRGYLAGKDTGAPVGHTPPGRIMVSFLLAVLLVQAATGLVLAGTDVFKAPFGSQIAHWIADGDAAAVDQMKQGAYDFTGNERFAEMRAVRKPIKETHEWLFYVLLGAVVLHVAGVVAGEFRHRNGLVSAMITGWKLRQGGDNEAAE